MDTPPSGRTRPAPFRLTGRRSRTLKEGAIGAVLFACAAASTLVTVGVVAVLLRETVGFFREVSFWEFVTSTRWEPMFRDQHFGVGSPGTELEFAL